MAAVVEPGTARSPGISYQALLDGDTHPVPEVLRLESARYLGDEDIPTRRYTSREWHERETERLWHRVWQFVCREEHLPEVGSYVVYDIVDLSFVIARTAPDEIKAYRNACLHRGRQLKDYDGRCTEFRCPYHGFTWQLDGRLKHIPSRWDFAHIDAREWTLPEAKVDTWAGFVFINPDPDAGPLADLLGDMPAHFERWNLEDRYVEAHVAKRIHANWKVVQEAFSESFHAATTHPQTAPYLGDTNSQIDLWDTFSRVITPGGTPSPSLRYEPSEEEMLRYMLDTRVDEETFINLQPGDTARTKAAAVARERWRPIVGDGVEEWSDAEFLDNIDYTLFPNFHPWGAYNRICYRFRPNGDDHRSAIMEVFLLAPFTGERPPPAECHWLDYDESWTDAPELGMLGKVFDQDSLNMPKVQRGMELSAKPGVTLATYQESKVRWHHQLLAEWVEGR